MTLIMKISQMKQEPLKIAMMTLNNTSVTQSMVRPLAIASSLTKLTMMRKIATAVTKITMKTTTMKNMITRMEKLIPGLSLTKKSFVELLMANHLYNEYLM